MEPEIRNEPGTIQQTKCPEATALWPEAVKREFKAILFAWGLDLPEGGAPSSSTLSQALEEALSQGLLCVIISDASRALVEERLLARLPGPLKRKVVLCTDRGAEIHAFGEGGIATPVRLKEWNGGSARQAREAALARAAEAVAKAFLGLGMPVEVRDGGPDLKRIDLLPAGPSMKQGGTGEGYARSALLACVQDRIRGVGFKRGLAEVVERVSAICSDSGLRDARIGSDVRHIELALTDRSDAVRWIKAGFLDPMGIAPGKTVVVGTEFGTAGGLPGKDFVMRVPGMEDAVFVSVGTESEGVPPQVIHLGGGYQCLAELLRLQARVQVPKEVGERAQVPQEVPKAIDEWMRTSDTGWILEQQGFNPSEERERETIFAIGNGYVGLRGSSNLLIPSSQADLFLAGVYDAKASDVPYSEAEFMTGADRDEPLCELVSFPFPFYVRISVGGVEFGTGITELAHYERRLDVKRALLFERYEFRDNQGRETSLRILRCLSLSDPHLLLHEIEVLCRNHSEAVNIETSLEDPDLRLKHPHLSSVQCGPDEGLADMRVFETRLAKTQVCFAARSAVDGQEVTENGFALRPVRGRPMRIQRLISIFTSRDVADPVSAAKSHITSKTWPRFGNYVSEHAGKWAQFWDAADIEVVGNPRVTETLRFNTYHLRIAAPDDPRASIGARTLSGRAYEGHIFWDVEVFILPFFIYSHPELARSLLRYRHSTLGGARERARLLGYGGACYAWESTAGGLDATPKVISLKGTDAAVPIFTGTQQIHVTGGVAYAINRYWQATGDTDFIRNYGAEILFETSRFWVSRSVERNGKFHIPGVVGPDEYHHGVNDNAYTNWMARYNVAGAVRAVDWLQANDHPSWERLKGQLELRDEEVTIWRLMAENIFIPEPDRRGVIPQFEGFFDLKDVPISAEERFRAPFDRLLKWQDINSSKLIKQADVLMIPFLFPNAYSTEIVRANYLYYERITDHGSSLSPSIHAAIASRIGDIEAMRKYWQAGLNLDLMNLMKNTALGFHAACAGGTWQALVFHILGIQFSEEGILHESIRPVELPTGGEAVNLRLKYRGKLEFCTIPAKKGRTAA